MCEIQDRVIGRGVKAVFDQKVILLGDCIPHRNSKFEKKKKKTTFRID